MAPCRLEFWRVGHLNGKYSAGLSLNVDRKQLRVRHFSRCSRSGLPNRRHRSTWRYAAGGRILHRHHVPLVSTHWTGLAQGIGAETAPAPEFRRGHQPALHRIPMHVTKSFDAFVFGGWPSPSQWGEDRFQDTMISGTNPRTHLGWCAESRVRSCPLEISSTGRCS